MAIVINLLIKLSGLDEGPADAANAVLQPSAIIPRPIWCPKDAEDRGHAITEKSNLII